jgi:hypothetical protein
MSVIGGIANPFVPDTVKIAAEQHIGDSAMVNTFYCRFASPSDSDLLDMANAVHDSWGYLYPHLSTAWSLDQVVATDIDHAGGHQQINATSQAGSLSDNPIPYQAAGLITWRTNRVGRNFRGRSYIGGWTEAHSAGNAPDSTATGDLEDFATALISVLNGIGNFVVVSRVELNPTPPPKSIYRTVNDTTSISGFTVRPGWATQRRRATPE